MINERVFEEAKREMEWAQREFSRVKNTIEQTKRQLAEFVLLNTELVSKGELDLSAYQEEIDDAELTMTCVQQTFEENKKRLVDMFSKLTLFG